ncbi:MAG: SpoIID/LytB domain-containing protein [Tumebacillaceae bacterium]
MKKRFLPILTLILSCMLIITGLSTQITHAAPPKKHYLSKTPFPPAIRVAIRENNPWGHPDPRGRIMYVKTYRTVDYMRNVLPVEWLPSWDSDSLQAGAIAVKMYAWYHHLNPVKTSGFTYDVDNTVNFQAFEERKNQPETDAAIARMGNLAYVMQDGEIFELNYRAGYRGSPNAQYRNAQKMAQWGSQYWAQRGRSYLQILQYYYENRLLTRIPR